MHDRLAVAGSRRSDGCRFAVSRTYTVRERLRRSHDVTGSPRGHHAAAVPAGAGPEIDHVIGALDGLRIVFHHQHRVSQVAQVLQRVQQPVIVARMQSDGGLIQHVQHAAKFRADLRRQPDALRLAAGQRGRRPLQA